MKLSILIKNLIFKTGFFSLSTLGSLAITIADANAAQIDFSSWQKFGDVTTPGLGQTNLSNNALQFEDLLDDSNFNYSGDPAGSARPFPDLQDFLGLEGEVLDIEGDALEGSAIKNIVTVAAGDVFSFDWNFRTNETQNKDFAFLLVDSTVIKLADFTNATQASNPFLQQTGLNSYTFTTSGTYTLAFGVVDIDDYGTTSALEVSNARVEKVPEPGTISALLIACGFGVRLRRRFVWQSSTQTSV